MWLSVIVSLLHFKFVVKAVAMDVDSLGKNKRIGKDSSSLLMRRDSDHYMNAAGATPSRGSLMKRRQTFVVAGHLASLVTVEGGETVDSERQRNVDNRIRNTFQKAKALTVCRKAEAQENAEQIATVDILKAIENKINNMEKSKQLMEDFQEYVLDLLDEGDGLTCGVVWNDDDANDWECSNEGTPCVNADGTNHVDVQLATASGSPIAQGDMAAGVGGGSMLQTNLFEAAVTHRRAQDNIWPLKAGDAHMHEVPYCFASGLSEEAKKAWMDAIQHTSAQVPCIEFKALTTKQGTNAFSDTVQENCESTPSIIVQSTQAGCWSLVGQVSEVAQFAGSSQPINLGKGCENLGIAAHEIGHAIGMLHEMSRTDRDKWVTIKKENIASSMIRNFENDTNADSKSPFDFLSLMIYGCYAFSTNGELTIEPHQLTLVNMMGQRMGFSELDIELIGKMYGCEDKIKPATKNKAMSQTYLKDEAINTGFTGNCADSEKTGFVTPNDAPMTCQELRKYCAHDTLGEEVRNLCPVACYQCVPGLGQELAPLAEDKAGNPPPGDGNSKAYRSASLAATLLVSLAAMIVMDRP
jgi:astacin